MRREGAYPDVMAGAVHGKILQTQKEEGEKKKKKKIKLASPTGNPSTGHASPAVQWCASVTICY
jgi:hypothetical protein